PYDLWSLDYTETLKPVNYGVLAAIGEKQQPFHWVIHVVHARARDAGSREMYVNFAGAVVRDADFSVLSSPSPAYAVPELSALRRLGAENALDQKGNAIAFGNSVETALRLPKRVRTRYGQLLDYVLAASPDGPEGFSRRLAEQGFPYRSPAQLKDDFQAD